MTKITLDKLKKSKKYLYFNAQKVRRNISSISIGLQKHSKELISLRKKVKDDFIIDDNIKVNIPSYKILSNILIDVEAFYKLLGKINYGKTNVAYYKNIKNLINSDFELSNIKKIYNNLINELKDTILKVKMEYIGINVKIFNIGNSIDDFRINHKNPDWRVNLKSFKFKSFKYPKTNILLDDIDNTLLLNKNISALKKAYMNTDLLEKKFYKLSKQLEDLYLDKKDDKYLYMISCLLSIYYLLEITQYKIYIWQNILLKYEIVLLKHMKKKE